VWISEKTTQSRDVAVALRLARRHLPIAATLPGPVLYTASDQISGHIGDRGDARGPVSVTIGGCTKHDPLVYLPIPEEQSLINTYEDCSRSLPLASTKPVIVIPIPTVMPRKLIKK
jgi:hypothetical protein